MAKSRHHFSDVLDRFKNNGHQNLQMEFFEGESVCRYSYSFFRFFKTSSEFINFLYSKNEEKNINKNACELICEVPVK